MKRPRPVGLAKQHCTVQGRSYDLTSPEGSYLQPVGTVIAILSVTF